MTADQIKELSQKKGYAKCQRITTTALQCLMTDAKYYTMNFVMDIYTNIYPQVKTMVQEFKPDHDYDQRKTHALITCVAAYFVNIQRSATGKQTLLFDIQRYFKIFAQKREIQVSIIDFQSQVEEISGREYV